MSEKPPFDAKEIELLLVVYEAVYRSLKAFGKVNHSEETIARKVIEAAETGERDPDRLRDLVLLALRKS
jgi:hypothetical protein